MHDPTPARGRCLEDYRDYLRALAGRAQAPWLRGKLDPSGVVQQTLLEAHLGLSGFRGETPEQLAAWLRRLLDNNLADEVRRLGARVRDAARDRPLEEALGRSPAGPPGGLAADQSTPSQRACRDEQLLRLTRALADLPADQRAAVELHHLMGLRLADVASSMGRTKGAVASLVFRGLRNLRDSLGDAA